MVQSLGICNVKTNPNEISITYGVDICPAMVKFRWRRSRERERVEEKEEEEEKKQVMKKKRRSR